MGKYAKKLAENLKRLVPGLYSNQTAFAKAAGITQSQASLYISGEALPKLDNLEGMAEALGVSVAGLIGEDAPKQAPPRKPTPEEFAIAFLENFDIDEKRRDICLFALGTDSPERLKTVHDTIRRWLPSVESSAPNNKKPTAG